MKSDKYYGGSLSGAIKTAYQHNIPPEDLVIITNTRFESPEQMAENYGPSAGRWGVWTAEETAYAVQVWEDGRIIQPRLHLHAVFENGRFGREIVGFEPGAAEAGTDADTRVNMSGVYTELYTDPTQMLVRDSNYKLLEELQKINQFPELTDSNGKTVDIRTYIEENAETLKYKHFLDGKDVVFLFEGEKGNLVPQIEVPNGTTLVDIEGADVVIVPESVKNISLAKDVNIIVCDNDIHRDMLDRSSYSDKIYMSKDEYARFTESEYTNPGEFIRAQSEPFLHDEKGEIIGIKSAFRHESTSIEIPEGEKINLREFAGSLLRCDKLATIIDGDNVLDSKAWLREQDPEPLRLSEDGTKFYGVKWYHSGIDTINLPESVQSLNSNVFMDGDCPGVKTIISHNPNLEITLPYENSFNYKEFPQLEIAIDGKEPQDLASAIKAQHEGIRLDSSGYIEGIHPLYKNDEVLVVPEGAVAYYKGLEDATYNTLELPSTFKSIGYEMLKDSVNTVIVNEEVEDLSIYTFDLARREQPLTIVCSDALREKLISDFQELAERAPRVEMSDFNNITLLSHAEFAAAREAASLNEQYPVLGEIDSSGKLAKFVNENALCYEEVDGVAKISFENGSGIIISNDTLVTCEISNGNELAVDAADTKDISTDKLLEILESIEKDGARETSLAVEADNTHDRDGGFSLDD